MRQENPVRIDTSQMATKGVVAVPGRTVPEPLQEPKKEGKGFGKGVRKALVAATALTALGGAGYAVYNEVPAINRTVDRWMHGAPLEEKFPILLPQENFTPVTPEEEKKLWEFVTRNDSKLRPEETAETEEETEEAEQEEAFIHIPIPTKFLPQQMLSCLDAPRETL